MPRPLIERLEDWTYKVEGYDDPFPSVTNIIKATTPKDLAWWGMQVGCEGVATLLRSGKISEHRLNTWTGEQFVALLSRHKLTVNDTMKAAGARGTEIHNALEAYGKTGELPETFSDAASGYSKALARWLLENRPVFYEQETMTASPEYRYAGTFDGKCIFYEGKLQGKSALFDIKTSKKVYKDQFFPQLEAYEHAERELGEDSTDLRVVIHLASDGKYRQVVSTDTFADFRVLLEHYQSIRNRKGRKRG